TPLLSFDGGTSSGAPGDALIVKGTAGADAFTVTGTQISLTGAGTLTYGNFQSLQIDGGARSDTPNGTFTGFAGALAAFNVDTATFTVGTLSGQITVNGGEITNSNITSVAAPNGLLQATEATGVLNSGRLSHSTFGTISGRVLVASIVDV